MDRRVGGRDSYFIGLVKDVKALMSPRSAAGISDEEADSPVEVSIFIWSCSIKYSDHSLPPKASDLSEENDHSGRKRGVVFCFLCPFGCLI